MILKISYSVLLDLRNYDLYKILYEILVYSIPATYAVNLISIRNSIERW
jgi:hypothetical protein